MDLFDYLHYSMHTVIVFVATVLVFGNLGSADLYCSMADLEKLLRTEALLIHNLEEYLWIQQQNLFVLQKYIDLYKHQLDSSSENPEVYVTNPINAFLLIKRLTTDWKHVQSLIATEAKQDILYKIAQQGSKFPSGEDLKGAAVGLATLQDTYDLKVPSLASGNLNGIQSKTQLTAGDCFELSLQLFQNEDYYHAAMWMEEADARLTEQETGKRTDILVYLALAVYKQGNIILALEHIATVLDMSPMHQKALEYKELFETELQERNDKDIEVVQNKVAIPPLFCGKLYYEVCRGAIVPPTRVTSNLKCYYEMNKNPFVRIAPFKVEEAYRQPDILLFHDVLSDNEIETIKKIAQPKFQRAKIFDAAGGGTYDLHRTSKSSWVIDNEHKHIAGISQRVGDMTGLVMQTAEPLQVANYGIGGQYRPHVDFSDANIKLSSFRAGNRLATILFYLSDVAQGGATAFTVIDVAVWPRKGKAVLWYNVHTDGVGDYRTCHVACPVLEGSKWIATKWVHEHGQEFQRPCDVKPSLVNIN